MTDFAALLRCLSEAGVEYILVGGAAATAHGSARLTQDVPQCPAAAAKPRLEVTRGQAEVREAEQVSGHGGALGRSEAGVSARGGRGRRRR